MRIQYSIAFLLLTLMVTAFSCPKDFVSIEGIWQQEGYGRVLEITKNKIKVYDIAKVSCVPNLTLPIKYIDYIGTVSNLTDNSLTVSEGINHMDFIRLDQMPKICQGYDNVDHDDPTHNFESVWNTFNEQYCAFGKRKANWDELYKKYRPLINKETSRVDLYIVLENMLDELKDGHVGMFEPDDISKKEQSEYVQKKNVNASTVPLNPSNAELIRLARKSILEQYVGQYEEFNKGVLRYGQMKNGMVYLQINAMERWADFGISNDLEPQAFWKKYLKEENKLIDGSQANVDGVNSILDKVIDSYTDASGYVLDIRFNGGGYDEVALSIMNHFAKEEATVFTKKARKGDLYTRTIKAKVTPSAKRFTENIFVLTSVETASAAEIMSLTAREMPNVTLIGSATEGIFSDILEKKMPNGWEYGLSNEIYETMDGQDFENIGVPPDHEIVYRRWTRGFLEDITKDLIDGDNAIELAMAIMQ